MFSYSVYLNAQTTCWTMRDSGWSEYFPAQASLGFTENSVKEKISIETKFSRQNVLLRPTWCIGVYSTNSNSNSNNYSLSLFPVVLRAEGTVRWMEEEELRERVEEVMWRRSSGIEFVDDLRWVQEDFEINSEFNWKPMELLQDWDDVVKWGGFGNNAI